MRNRCVGLLAALLLLTSAWSAAAAPMLVEHFDNIATLGATGWASVNNSSPIGLTDWFQGNPGVFSAYAGAPDAYIASNFLAADSGGNISLWGLTPEISFDQGARLTFYARSAGSFPGDRLEVRYSTNGSSTDVGATSSSVGDFANIIRIIVWAGDTGWNEYHAFVPRSPGTTGRLAFRYAVTDTNLNGDYIGVDEVEVAAIPEPATLTLVGLGAAALGLRRRRR